MDPHTHSDDGREWAKLSEMKPGIADIFSCGISNKTLPVYQDPVNGELCVKCEGGNHYLSAQMAVGRYQVPEEEFQRAVRTI